MIVFVSNFYNHHQSALSEELFKLTDGAYRFVEMSPIPDEFVKSGYPVYNPSRLLVQAWKSDTDLNYAYQLINNADVVLYGNFDNLNLIKKRLSNNKLTFEVGERWLKRGGGNLLSPRLLKNQCFYHLYFYNKQLFRLCASAFAAGDLAKFHSFKNRCFKWGYFTIVPDIDADAIIKARSKEHEVRFISVARFIHWKHHELTVKAAKILFDEGYNFTVDIYGSGSEFLKIKRLIEKLRIEHIVRLRGNIPNQLIMEELRKHDAMIFCSDKNEGWGAVVNEAMGNTCPVIGSDKIGSVPFLIKNEQNGLIFRSGDVHDLAKQMIRIVESKELRQTLAANAYSTMKNTWSPQVAAKRLLILIESLTSRTELPLQEGPCSVALPI